MREERMRILEMLDAGRITAAEAADLLRAIPGESGETSPAPVGAPFDALGEAYPRHNGSRRLRVRITDQESGQERANVAIPLSMLDVPLSMARVLGVVPPNGPLDALLTAVLNGQARTSFGVSSGPGGERIELMVE